MKFVAALSQFLLLLLSLSTTTVVVNAQDDEADDDEILETTLVARYKNDDGVAALLAVDADGELDLQIERFNLAAIKVSDEDDIQSIVADLRANENIEAVVSDFRRSIGPPGPVDDDDEGEGDNRRRQRKLKKESVEYGIELVQADQLFELADDAPGSINVCVVDTGIEEGHEDLPTSAANGLTGTDGFRITEISGTWDNDGNGHGTHCAGVIGAIGDNDQGVVGVRKNPNLFTFHIGKGLSDEGGGLTSNILRALASCLEEPVNAKVISMSLGGPYYSAIEEFVYKLLYDMDILIVAAAGNDGNTEFSYPASYPTVISVAAVDKKENWADFSQRNNQIELSGPGVNVLSTYIGNSYEKLSGTSMACPHVAGVAAEVWSHFPECTNNQIRNALIRSAKDLGAQKGYDGIYGYGLVQAKDAYDLLKAEGCEGAGGPVTEPLSDGAKGGCRQESETNSIQFCNDLDLTAGATALSTKMTILGMTMSVVVSMICLF